MYCKENLKLININEIGEKSTKVIKKALVDLKCHN